MNFLKIMVRFANIVIEICYCHINMNLLVYFVDITDNGIKRKNEVIKISTKKTNFVNRFKNFVLVYTFMKFMKLTIVIKDMKFYQHSKTKN